MKFLNQERCLLLLVFPLPPSLGHRTCFKLSARNTIYTQQKPSWVTIRKKLTMCLEGSKRRGRERNLL
jgi:hypothetical protein